MGPVKDRTGARVWAKASISLGLVGGLALLAIGYCGQAGSAVAAYGKLGDCGLGCDHAVAAPAPLTWADIVFYIGAIGGAAAVLGGILALVVLPRRSR